MFITPRPLPLEWPENEMHVFSAAAQRFWDAIAPRTQQMLLTSVWCCQCRDAVTLVDVSGRMERGNLILHGRCENYRTEIARMIEGPASQRPGR
jgi:hypothetical protein